LTPSFCPTIGVHSIPHIRELQALASQHGIHDVFQDNGGKILQVLLVTGLKAIPGREGNDARDADGNEYEMKSVNRFDTAGNEKRNPQFTTHHHLNQKIVDKYRQVDWIFAVYAGIELEAVYLLTPEKMEPCYQKWESDSQRKIAEGKSGDLNNPKINLRYVQEHGIQLYLNQRAPKPEDSDFMDVLGDVETEATEEE
jgi:hypothetical protein